MTLVLSLFSLVAWASSVPVGGSCRVVGSEAGTAAKESELGAQEFFHVEITNPKAKLKTISRDCRKQDLGGYIAHAKKEIVSRSDIQSENESDWDKYVGKKFALSVERCSILSNGGANSLLILETSVRAKFNPPVKGGTRLLSLFHLDSSGKPRNNLSQIFSYLTTKDFQKQVTIENLCDLDDDGNAELILLYDGALGHHYEVITFSSDLTSAVTKKFQGRRGDG